MNPICVVSDVPDELKRRLMSAQLPCMQTAAFTLLWEQPAPDSLYIIKQDRGLSVLESLEGKDACQASEAVKGKLRQFAVNQQAEAAQFYNDTGNNVWQEFLCCLEDGDFVGLIFCNLSVSSITNEWLGPENLVRRFSYEVPFIKIEQVIFDDERIDGSQGILRGWLSSCGDGILCSDGDESFSIRLKSVVSEIGKDGFYNPVLRAELALHRLMGSQVHAAGGLNFYGIYTRVMSAAGSLCTYRFAMTGENTFHFEMGSLRILSVEQAAVGFEQTGDKISLDLNCTGYMQFAALENGFDPFGGKFKYQGLHLKLELELSQSGGSGVLKENYRNICVTERKELLRDKAVFGQIPHGQLQFLSWQDGDTPEKLGFKQIEAPVQQSKLQAGAKWIGLVMPVELFHGISLQILFAFAERAPFFAGGKLCFGKGGTGIPVSSLMQLQVTEVMFYREQNGAVRLMLKGLKMSLFGLKLPEGSVNVALLPGEGGKLAWFCVYEA